MRSSRRSSARSRTAGRAGCRSCCSSRAVHRRDVLHRLDPGLARARPVHRRELRLPGRAHLLRRDAEVGELPGDARQAVRARDRDRLLRDGLRRAADLPARRAGRGPVPADVDPVPALRDPDLRVRPRAADRRPAGDHRGRDPRFVRAAPPVDRPRPRGPGSRAVPRSAGSSTPMRSTRSSWS